MFTVVIPLFNKAHTLQQTLDSVFSQSFAPAEILIVNDGSTDGGAKIARLHSDPRVRVIDQGNLGVSAARNAGLRAASQPFVAFLDADDRWRPAFLEKMRALITQYPGASLYGAGFYTVEGNAIKRYHGTGRANNASRSSGVVDFFAEWLRDFPLHTSTTVVPREATLTLGGFSEGVAVAEDHLFWVRMALAGPVAISPEPLLEYDVSVPGQFIRYWKTTYRERFDILEYHRLLADELLKRINSGRASDSFSAFARKELRTAVLQRMYWGNFAAVERIWRELDLERLGLGVAAEASARVAHQPMLQAMMRPSLSILRSLRRR